MQIQTAVQKNFVNSDISMWAFSKQVSKSEGLKD